MVNVESGMIEHFSQFSCLDEDGWVAHEVKGEFVEQDILHYLLHFVGQKTVEQNSAQRLLCVSNLALLDFSKPIIIILTQILQSLVKKRLI